MTNLNLYKSRKNSAEQLYHSETIKSADNYRAGFVGIHQLQISNRDRNFNMLEKNATMISARQPLF